ncbi:LuxR C-terminal-related transcriptional regulator [Nocardioides pantholopis]|uniref:LuxR C-terminal-related transcriptional regulator n=1 Tax=Nocardioides pantholopis TaxID=2483798 RepID=UPI000F0882D2|nr:response regulator transcription factor [Nocardioides pantholopis]
MRVVLGEDQALLRVGLTRILEASGCAVLEAAEDAASLERALARPDADLGLVDVRMPPSYTNEGLLAAIAARRARPSFPVLVLSQYVEPLYARDLLADGAGGVGYLLKDRVAEVDGFVAALRRVAAGGTVLDPEVVAGLVGGAGREHPVTRLTPREREVLTLMAEGRSNAAIAGRLQVSEKAVGKHSSAIFTKLDLPQDTDDNRRVLAVLAWLEGGG